MATKSKHIINRTIVYLALLLFALLCVLPFWLMLVNATRSNQEINAGISLFPGSVLWDNVQTLIDGRLNPDTGVRVNGINVVRGFLNSLVIASSSTALSAYFGTLAAFGFLMYRFRFRKFLFGLVLAIIMVPATVNLIGTYKLIINLGILDTYWPLILPAIANPFAVFFLRNYLFAALPTSIVEAARIDGASELNIFHRIVLPMASPGIATISIFGFLGAWNNYLLPLIVLNTQDFYTLPLLIQLLNTTTFNRDLGALYMGVAISVVPILIAFAFFSRYLIEGIAGGSVKE